MCWLWMEDKQPKKSEHRARVARVVIDSGAASAKSV